MAKIDPTSLFTEIRGTVGGLTFSRNRAGFFVQRVNRPIPSTRPAPQAKRQAFTTAAVYWNLIRNNLYFHPDKGLIPVSQWWNDFALEPENQKIDVFGTPYNATGYNWFIAFAILQSMQGLSPMILPPEDPTPPVWPTWSVTYHASPAVDATSFVSPSTSAGQNSYVWISARIQYSLNVSPVVPPFFFLKAFSYNEPGVPFPLQNEMEAVFGNIPYTTRAFFSVRFRIPNGRLSAPYNFSLLDGETYSYVSP